MIKKISIPITNIGAIMALIGAITDHMSWYVAICIMLVGLRPITSKWGYYESSRQQRQD